MILFHFSLITIHSRPICADKHRNSKSQSSTPESEYFPAFFNQRNPSLSYQFLILRAPTIDVLETAQSLSRSPSTVPPPCSRSPWRVDLSCRQIQQNPNISSNPLYPVSSFQPAILFWTSSAAIHLTTIQYPRSFSRQSIDAFQLEFRFHSATNNTSTPETKPPQIQFCVEPQ